MKRKHSESAFTILEVLIAVIIIGILTSILVPVLSNRSADAKITAAKAELKNIADAEERVAIHTGYFVRLYALDDLIGGDAVGFGVTGDRLDGVRDEKLNAIVTTGEQMFIDPASGIQLLPANQNVAYTRLTSNETSFGWQGPYYTIHRDEAAAPDPTDSTLGRQVGHLAGIPTDPWGNDYILLTKRGALNEPAGTIDATLALSGGGTVNAEVFDRPTVLSLGPNGVPGDADTTSQNFNKLGKGDDLYYSFGN